MPAVHVDDVDLNYRRRGTGPPVLFIAGYSADNLYWNLQLDAFSRRLDAAADTTRRP